MEINSRVGEKKKEKRRLEMGGKKKNYFDILASIHDYRQAEERESGKKQTHECASL